MKKDLAVRAGAIAMVLIVAFFSILPEWVNAEGDDAEPVEEVLIAQEIPDEPAEEAGISDEEVSADAETPADTKTPVDTEAPSDTGTPVDTEAPSDTGTPVDTEAPSDTGTPVDTEAPADMGTPVDTEAPADMETPVDTEAAADMAVLPEEVTGNPPAAAEGQVSAVEGQGQSGNAAAVVSPDAGGQAADAAVAEMDTIEDYLSILDENMDGESKAESILFRLEDGMDMMEMYALARSADDDFLMDEDGMTVIGYQGDGGVITIPDTALVIGDAAFAGVTTITGVVIPSGIVRIGAYAFSGCVNLKAVSVPDTVTNVGEGAFANCSGLANASISANSGSISANQFNNCISLSAVEVPEGIAGVESGAFSGCSNLGSISLPSTLESLDMSAFSGDVNLASVSVASGNYSSYDGCVYTAGGGRLLFCPQGKTSIAFAPGMKSVASGAFAGCGYLLSAVVPATAASIEANAFSGSGIKAVTIPNSITAIGKQPEWTPNVIYGYRKSAAEAWANENHYIFESLDAAPDGMAIQEESIKDKKGAGADSGDDDDDDDSSSGSKGGSSGKKISSSAPAVNLGESGMGSGTAVEISRGAAGDQTPKTGVEDFGIYFLFGAVFLAGISMITYSRKLRFEKKASK